MIDVKIIAKPKNEGSTSAIKTSGTAYGGMAVKEAAHAAKADVAELAYEATLAKKGDSAGVTKDMGRTVVRIKNKYIRQKNANLQTIPAMPTNASGEKEAIPVYLAFFYRCATAGRLTVDFENVDKSGFADFNALHVEEDLAQTDGYKQYTCNGLWNGTGDFKLSFTGDIYLYMLILSTDKVESLTYKYKTLFEQSERLVKISAAVFDKDENALRETGLMVQPEGTGIYVRDANGKLALIGVGVEETDSEGNAKTVIKLTSDNIKLEGLVTANGYFKIKEDGSIEAVNADLHGNLTSADDVHGNSVVINAEQGYIKMRGPSGVQDDDHSLPASDKRTDLFKLQFETDSDSLSRTSTMYLYGRGNTLRIDPIEGISIQGMGESVARTLIYEQHIALSSAMGGETEISPGYISVSDNDGKCVISPTGISFYDASGNLKKTIS